MVFTMYIMTFFEYNTFQNHEQRLLKKFSIPNTFYIVEFKQFLWLY